MKSTSKLIHYLNLTNIVGLIRATKYSSLIVSDSFYEELVYQPKRASRPEYSTS